MLPPLPEGNFRLFPIVFLRHPIIRAKSAYLFEHGIQQKLETSSAGFRDYVAARIQDANGGVITNFQACRLANQYAGGPDPTAPASEDGYAQQACRFIDSLEFFGMVEQFRESLIRLKYYLTSHFPELKLQYTRQNVTQNTELSIPKHTANIAAELGPELYQALTDRNKQDLALYQHACQRFDNPLG